MTDKLLVRHAFTEFKINYERIRDFKVKIASKMLRSALSEFKRAAMKQKRIKALLKQRFREKTRSLASQILAEWSKTAKKYKVIKH